MSDAEALKLRVKLAAAFSPSAPIDRLSLFAGRIEQLRTFGSAIPARGRHVIVYGERGVGKTSLTNILRDVFSDAAGMKIVRVNCNEQDTFQSVWQRAMNEVDVFVEPQSPPGEHAEAVNLSLDTQLEEFQTVGPRELSKILQRWTQPDFELVLVFDEFDRLAIDERAPFADTIKDLSDHSAHATLVLVGVATDVLDLLDEHESVERCLEQILMPVMSDREITEILAKATNQLVELDDDAKRRVVRLSQGFPHYAHLIGQEACFSAADACRTNVTMTDVEAGVDQATRKCQQTIKQKYSEASHAQRKGTLFPQVLLACAMAETDELGHFTSVTVRTPLRKITGRDIDIPNFSQHLDKLATDESRGLVLEKVGASRRYRFRFRNPLLKPFVIMKGLSERMITPEMLELDSQE